MRNNIVILCLDTVRKDYYERFAPRLKTRADISFDQCRAASSWSVPSHGSMFTGELPSQHGIHAYNRDLSSLNRHETFLGDLPEYEAVGVSANAYASDLFGFDGLFDDFRTITRRMRYPDGMNVSEFGTRYSGNHRFLAYLKKSLGHTHPLQSLANGIFFKASQVNETLPFPKLFDSGGSLVSNEVRRQAVETSEPFVQFVNLMDAHGPLYHHLGLERKLHDAPNSWNSASGVSTWEINKGDDIEDHETSIRYARGLYAASIDYLDRIVSILIDDIQDHTTNETTFIITSDHGENLVHPGDDFLFEHTGSLSEGLLHVPLDIINAPDCYGDSGARYISQLQLGDLVTKVANDRDYNPMKEVIAAEVVGGNHLPDDASEYWDRSIRCAYKGQRKFVWDSLGNTTAYSLSDSPSTQELVETDISIPEWASDQFTEDIETTKREAKESQVETNVTPGVQQRLNDLGYTTS